MHYQGVDLCLPTLVIRVAAGGRQTGHRVVLLHGHRNSEKLSTLAFGQGGVGCVRGGTGPFEIPYDDGVDLRIERLDTLDRVIHQLAGGNLAVGKHLYQITSRAVDEPS